MEDTFCLTFEAGVPGIGEPISLQLRGDGCEPVTEDNRRAYVDAYVDCVLNTSIHKQARTWATSKAVSMLCAVGRREYA